MDSNAYRRPNTAGSNNYDGNNSKYIVHNKFKHTAGGNNRRPKSAGIIRKTIPSKLQTKTKINRLQTMLNKSRNSFSGGSDMGGIRVHSGNNSYQQVHGISVNSRNHRVAKLRKDIKLVEHYVLHGRGKHPDKLSKDEQDRKFINEHSYLYDRNRMPETKSGQSLAMGSAQFLHPYHQQQNINNMEDKFLSPWDDTDKDKLDETGMVHIPTSSAQWQIGAASPSPRLSSFSAKYEDDHYQHDIADAAKRAALEANDATAFKPEIERKNSQRNINKENFKVMKSNMPISSPPIESFCRDVKSKEYLKNAIAATNEPRYANVMYKSCTNVKNTDNNNQDGQEESITTYLSVKKLQNEERRMVTESKYQWSNNRYQDGGGMSLSARNRKALSASSNGARQATKEPSYSPPYSQIISIDTRPIKKNEKRRNRYGTVIAQQLHHNRQNGVKSMSIAKSWKTRPMSASLRRHKLIGEKASKKLRSNVNPKFSIMSIDGNKRGIFNVTQREHNNKEVHNRFRSRSRPKSASRVRRRTKRANTAIGENVGGPNFQQTSMRSRKTRPQTAGGRRLAVGTQHGKQHSLNLFVGSSKNSI